MSCRKKRKTKVHRQGTKKEEKRHELQKYREGEQKIVKDEQL